MRNGGLGGIRRTCEPDADIISSITILSFPGQNRTNPFLFLIILRAATK